ncbi:hypothetical protein AB0H63_03195 [Micromonospora echinospora]|uniref:hypothetical protein n=1 Tax=Micromonospora echinospora TaxID=1877 RepID=UPI0033F24253
MSIDILMTDHPAWRSDGTVSRRPIQVDAHTTWLVEADKGQVNWTVHSGTGAPPTIDVFALPSATPMPAAPLHTGLSTLGQVGRISNPSLWDALATAIVRQVIRARQARKLYQEFCDRFGDRIALSDQSDIHTFPTPDRMLTLSDAEFTGCGMAFKRRSLRCAAEAYLAHGQTWTELAPSVLVKELQTIPGIGPWSAGAAVADFSHDWSLYPYGDLAVRTWAGHAAPDYAWPGDEASFARTWRRVTGEHLGTYTVFTLAFGCRQAGAV